MSHKSIVKLSSSAVAQIKSSVVINSLNDVVIGLIKNCIDAQAVKINVHINYTNGSCTVEDNGSGIVPSEFGADRGLAKLHYSSKLTEAFPEMRCHGTYGRFLYSIAALSTMTITSRHRLYHSIGILTMKESRVITRKTLVSSQTQLLYKTGTKIVIQELFSSMPVRMKHRTRECAEVVNLKRQYSGLIRTITALLLAWGSAITIVIAEVHIRDVLCIKSTRSRRCQSQSLNAFVSVLYQARLISTPEKASWIPVEASNQKMKVYGAISLQAAPTRNIQFLSMDVIPVENADSFGLLYAAINRCFDNSAYGSHEIANVSSSTTSGVQHTNDISKTSTCVELGKGIDRSPMFYLRIDVRQRHKHELAKGIEYADDLIEQAALLQEICDFLHLVCTNFLRKQYLHPTHTGEVSLRISSTASFQVLNSLQDNITNQPTCNEGPKQLKSILKPSKNMLQDFGSSIIVPSFRSDRRPESLEYSPGWSTMRSGQKKTPKACFGGGTSTSQKTLATPPSCAVTASQLMPDSLAKTSPSLDQTQAISTLGVISVPKSNVMKSGQLLRQPFRDTTNTQPACNLGIVSRNEQQNDIDKDLEKAALIWVDPATKLRSVIDSLTGSEVHKTHNKSDNIVLRRFSPATIDRIIVNSVQPAWLAKSLQEWQNPVFQSTEVSIPQVSTTKLDHICKSHCPQDDIAQGPRSSSERISNISRQALQQARVIAQVDRKFILININSGDGSGLVLVDQHAADERCGVEELLDELCRSQCNDSDYIETLKLNQPILLELQTVESRQLDLIKDYFRRWGICFHKLPTIDSTRLGMDRFQVTHLPPTILKRCVLSSNLLVSLMRNELPKRHQDRKPMAAKNSTSTDNKDVTVHDDDEARSWLRRIHDCPKGILDIINSRACRSAIMFNDELSLNQCQALISRLAKCAFPFQCAHGRPSMAPLVDLASLRTLSQV